MDVIVRKPTAQEVEELKKQPTWSCGVSEFDWHYDQEEVCLILEGEVTVKFANQSVEINSGDYAVFSKGLSCVWQVRKPVRKHYIFR